MELLIGAVLGGFFGAVFTLLCTILYNRLKRPAPNYNFEFEKEVSFQSAVQTPLSMVIQTTGYFSNYIRIKNYSDSPLFDVSTKIWFDTRKERRYYQTMGLGENLFDWNTEQLSALSHPDFQYESLLSMRGEEEVFDNRIKQGFFIPDEAMEKLKRLSPIKVKVEYEWEGYNYSDIRLFDFSDENEVRFYLSNLTFWQNTKLFLKRMF